MQLDFGGPIFKYLNPLTWATVMPTRIPLHVKTP
jgi:hypothetical protein